MIRLRKMLGTPKRRRITFYALSIPMILFSALIAVDTYAASQNASLVNGHNPIESSPPELGFSTLGLGDSK